MWAVIVVGTLVVVGFVIAYVLSGPLRLRNLYRTAFFLPTAAALVVVALRLALHLRRAPSGRSTRSCATSGWTTSPGRGSPTPR